MGGEVVLLEERDEGRDVVLLIVVGVGRGDGIGGGSGNGVVVGDVCNKRSIDIRAHTSMGKALTGGETTDTVGSTGTREEVTEELSSRGDVSGPSEPSSVTGVEVEVDVGLAEFLDGVDGHALVDILGSGAARVAQVGDQVGKRIGLDDSDDTDLGVLCAKSIRHPI